MFYQSKTTIFNNSPFSVVAQISSDLSLFFNLCRRNPVPSEEKARSKCIWNLSSFFYRLFSTCYRILGRLKVPRASLLARKIGAYPVRAPPWTLDRAQRGFGGDPGTNVQRCSTMFESIVGRIFIDLRRFMITCLNSEVRFAPADIP